MEQFIKVGKLNQELLNKIKIKLITEEVILTHERREHVEDKRVKLYNEVINILPNAIYNPDYIYKDWNNRENTLVLISAINREEKLNIVIKIAIENDEKHTKNSIITMIKIGEKTLKKIQNNKSGNLLYKKLDKNE